MEGNRVDVSVVIPVYRSEDCLEKLVHALTMAFEKSGRTYEIVFVNDCSPDRSWEKIVTLAHYYESVRGVTFRRNYGQDNALMAGLRMVAGRMVLVMDDDLQHGPEEAEKLLRKIESGVDVCYGRFPRKKQKWWKNMGSWLNDKVANIVINKPKHIYLSPYKAIAREIVDEIIKYDGPYPYIDGLLFRVTENVTQVDVEHHDRYGGEGNYNVRRSVSVWLRLATNFSLIPLRLATYLGLGFSGIGLFLAILFIVQKLIGSDAPYGWASTIVTILVLGGVQLACLGLIGEYLGRVFLHLNKRPQYVIKDSVGLTVLGLDERDRRF